MSFLDWLLVGSPHKYAPGQSFLSLILDGQGGIIDDTIVNIGSSSAHMVLNAANKHSDLAHFHVLKELYFPKGPDLTITPLFELCLLAIQGPEAATVLPKVLPGVDLAALYFMNHFWVNDPNFGQLMICRCGYTGEDGFEITV
jgi:glycine cleavage system aminomethyltransferase T